MSVSVLVALLLVINAVVRALRATGQLTGEPDHDRRKVLGLLGSLPLGVLVGAEPGAEPMPKPEGLLTFARPLFRRHYSTIGDALDASPELTEIVSRVIHFSFDGLFSRAECETWGAP